MDSRVIRKAEFSAVSAQDAVAIWPAEEAYATSVSSSLKAVQSSAKGWQTALTAILGLVTVVSLVGGRSALQMLSGAMQAWIVIFAAVAVAANAWGIYKSTLASIGFPAIKRAKSALELSNSDLWPLQQTIHAVDNLQAAVLSSALAFVAGVVVVGFVWLAPNAAAPAVTVNLIPAPTVTYPMTSVAGIAPGSC